MLTTPTNTTFARSAAEQLAEHVESRISDPAVIFPGKLVEETMREQRSGIPLVHIAPWKPFQVPFALSFFLGATYDGNVNEDEHLHPAQAELYLPVTGLLRVECWFGKHFDQYLVGPGDVLLVPPGRWHFIEWAEPGWCWVIKGPNHLQGDAAKLVRKRTSR